MAPMSSYSPTLLGERVASAQQPFDQHRPQKRRLVWVDDAEALSTAPDKKRQHHDVSSAFDLQTVVQPKPRLADRFLVSETVLGSGQFGAVRTCTDKVTGEVLACKSVKTSHAPFHREEVVQEAHLLKKLSGHPNIVQLHDVIEEEGEVHLVMEHCQGGELFDEIVRRRRFSERDAAVIFLEVAHAVAFCHAQGIMHRDIKPENILLTRKLPQGVPLEELTKHGALVKLADFGFAAQSDPHDIAVGVAGSPFYLAPEVLTGAYDSKADVWSLGVILYILLSGEPPFWGLTDEEVFESIIFEEPDFSGPLWENVSIEARSLVKCCLKKDHSHRPMAEKILTHPWFSWQLKSSIMDSHEEEKGGP